MKKVILIFGSPKISHAGNLIFGQVISFPGPYFSLCVLLSVTGYLNFISLCNLDYQDKYKVLFYMFKNRKLVLMSSKVL